jgi:uncharacterized protein (TIRG00374 family)
LKKANTWLRLIGIGLLGYLLWKTDTSELLAVLGKVSIPLLLLAVILDIPSVVLKSLRWRSLMRAQDIHYSLWQSILAYYSTIFLGLFTPGRLGEFAKAIYVSADSDVPIGKALSSVLVDRLFDLLLLIMVGCLALFTTTTLNAWQTWLSIALIAVGLVLAWWLYMTDKGFDWASQLASRLLGRMSRKLLAPESWLIEIRLGLKQLPSQTLLVASIITTLAYLVLFCQCYILALALELPISYLITSYAVALGSLITLLPISISGIGTRDAVIITYLGSLGIPAEGALGFSLLISLMFYTSGGLMGFAAWWLKPLPTNV